MAEFLTVILTNANITDKKKDTYYTTYKLLTTLLSTSLSKTNQLKVFIRTETNILIDFNSTISLPSNIREYSDVMSHLVRSLKLKSDDGKILARVVKNPVSNHLTPNRLRFGINPTSEKISKEQILKNKECGYTLYVPVEGAHEEVDFYCRVSDVEIPIENSCIRVVSIFEDLLENN